MISPRPGAYGSGTFSAVAGACRQPDAATARGNARATARQQARVSIAPHDPRSTARPSMRGDRDNVPGGRLWKRDTTAAEPTDDERPGIARDGRREVGHPVL